ncbi:MAG: response regulator transcription factor [Salinibacterium sp.]|nr:response regulator transcription factor [Salinibacterium sp.]
MTVTVLLVDDHPVVRSGVRAVLSTEPGISVIGEAASGEEALPLARALRPDVVLCDLRLGAGLDGVATTAALRKLDPAPAVIILTTYDHDHDILRAVEAGAAGYLLKDVAPATIAASLHDAAAGRLVLAPEMAQRVLSTMGSPRPNLSDRETEVLRLVSAGQSNSEIARTLFLTGATVKSHLVHVYTKLGVDSRTQAIVKGRSLGIID